MRNSPKGDTSQRIQMSFSKNHMNKTDTKGLRTQVQNIE
jgi:hypothetical protein